MAVPSLVLLEWDGGFECGAIQVIVCAGVPVCVCARGARIVLGGLGERRNCGTPQGVLPPWIAACSQSIPRLLPHTFAFTGSTM